MAYRNELGKAGEKAAVEYLKASGYRILQTNFRCKLGEIDVIGMDGQYIAFVEVKTRTNSHYGFPAESINLKKQKTMIKVAQTYMAFKKLFNTNFRFDVVEVMMDNKGGSKRIDIKLLKNAFQGVTL